MGKLFIAPDPGVTEDNNVAMLSERVVEYCYWLEDDFRIVSR